MGLNGLSGVIPVLGPFLQLWFLSGPTTPCRPSTRNNFLFPHVGLVLDAVLACLMQTEYQELMAPSNTLPVESSIDYLVSLISNLSHSNSLECLSYILLETFFVKTSAVFFLIQTKTIFMNPSMMNSWM